MRVWLREVGRGAKGARDLSYDEAYAAANEILDGRATDAQIGAFFMAERMKGESVDELHAFVRALSDRNPPPLLAEKGVLDCAGPYDGRAKSFAATIPSAIVLIACGVPVFLHAPEALPPKHGVSIKSVVQVLGLPVGRGGQRAGSFLFVDPEEIHVSLRALRGIREQLGVRTLLNTVEKLLNLSGADYLVTGVFHGTAMEKVAELAARLPYRRVMVVQGVDGSEDLPIHRASAVSVVEGGRVIRHRVDPEALGLKSAVGSVQLTPAEHAAHAEAILCGKEDPFRNMVLLNAGARLWLVERAQSMEEGIEIAQDTLDSGRAWELFQVLVKGM
ncbi:anthranilate phosphoribosyltransferase [Alicyclobacillus mali (ex Roth et al. 2021)]|uniref:anthranilate phosphoribosyltransferase n=1 Tax=Alicyclobacillus mali (ex Roth et al. 2021) TaxID=1123961 RepID=UPI001A8EFC19|nr:anthranilate phosphoribosyltransferase [Alicyclobacillus mali (ex Roth et al. 2021)]MCL6488988.1 anthranilate phosphoribosyltransferase [Alicyclobacillus mali (ex Roth et al. 2021)]